MPRQPAAGGLTAAYLGTFMVLLDVSIVTVALPSIQRAFQVDLSGAQWVVDAFAVCLAAFLLTGGLLGDRFGRRRVYLWGAALFAVASLGCSLAPTLPTLVVGVIVQGLAGAAVVPGALSLLGRSTDDPRLRGRLFGWWGMVASAAVVLGPLVGGALVDTLGWRSIFLVSIPLAIVIVLAGRVGLEESADPQHASFDPVGQVCAILALASVSVGAIELAHLPTSTPIVIVAGCALVASLVAFIVAERRVSRPMLPPALFRIRQFSIVNAATVTLGFGVNGSFLLLTLYLQQVRGASPFQAGLLLAPMSVAILVSSLIAGRILGHTGPSVPLVIGYAVTGATFAALAFIDTDTPLVLVCILFGVSGLAQGLAAVPAPAAVLQVVPRERSGVASAVVSAARQTGSAIGLAVLPAIVAASLPAEGMGTPTTRAEGFVAGMHLSIGIGAAAMLIAAAALIFVRADPDARTRTSKSERDRNRR